MLITTVIILELPVEILRKLTARIAVLHPGKLISSIGTCHIKLLKGDIDILLHDFGLHGP